MLVLLLQVASRDDLAVRLMGLQVLATKQYGQAEETVRTAHRLIGEECQVADLLTLCKELFQADNL